MDTAQGQRAQLEVAGGSVAGRSHQRAAKANQDAYGWDFTLRHCVAVVCDGCSGGAHSEAGAQIGVRLVAQAVRRNLGHDAPTCAGFWSRVRADVLAELGALCRAMGGAPADTVRDYLLFTVVGAVIATTDPTEPAVAFSIGDGAIWCNDTAVSLGPVAGPPFSHNQPAYLAYALLDEFAGANAAGALDFQLHPLGPSAAVESIAVGSDGVAALEPAMVRELWQGERYFRNPDMVRRCLTLASRRSAGQGDAFLDDTTVIVLRRAMLDARSDDGGAREHI